MPTGFRSVRLPLQPWELLNPFLEQEYLLLLIHDLWSFSTAHRADIGECVNLEEKEKTCPGFRYTSLTSV